jgi:cytoskeletal protein RodZ
MMSGSPGTVLRRCREFHGFTLEEASDTTKIGISYLKALDEDNIHEFANQAYLKGFLRIYAAYLGLNSDDVARMYDKLFGIRNEKVDPVRPTTAPLHPPRRLVSLKKLLFPAFLLAAILITATFFKRPAPPVVRQTPPPVSVAPILPNAAVQAVQSSAQIGKPEKVVPPSKVEKRLTERADEEKHPADKVDTEKTVTPLRSAGATRGFVLKIKVVQNGTLTSTVDGAAPQQYDLAVGDVIEWKAEKDVTLELSDAGGVVVELNGKPYKQLGPSGKPAYVELDATGIKQ